MTRLITALLTWITPSRFGGLTALLALAVLATAYISQYLFGLYPCTLCLWQRVPYGVMVLCGLILMRTQTPHLSLSLMGLLSILWIISLGLSVYHFGVEEKWWVFGGGCSADLYATSQSIDDLLSMIKNAPVTRCDEPVDFLFGFSMAFYNILLSLAGFVICISLTYRQYRATR